MTTLASGSPAVTALLRLSLLLRAGAKVVRTLALRFDAWIARRREMRASIESLQTMTDRELRDIGLHRYDMERGGIGVRIPGRYRALWI